MGGARTNQGPRFEQGSALANGIRSSSSTASAASASSRREVAHPTRALVAIATLLVTVTACTNGTTDSAEDAAPSAPATTANAVPCEGCPPDSGLRLVGRCDLVPGQAPLSELVAFDEPTVEVLSTCRPVPEVIGLTEQEVTDMLGEVGWENRTIYRDQPLDYAEDLKASRVSLMVVDGKVVDARWG